MPKKHFMLSLDEELINEWKEQRQITNLSGSIEWLIRQDLDRAKKDKKLPEGVEDEQIIGGEIYWKIHGTWVPKKLAIGLSKMGQEIKKVKRDR